MRRKSFIRKISMLVIIVLLMGMSFVFPKDVLASSKPKAPAKVTKLKVSSRGTSYIKIKWKKVKKNVSGYAVYRNGKLIKRVKGSGSTSYVDKGLVSGKKYTYRVCAYKTYKQIKWFNKKTKKWQVKKPSKKNRGKAKKFVCYKNGKKSISVNARTKSIISEEEKSVDELTITEIRNEMLKQINAERAKVGNKPLTMYDQLNVLAQIKAEDMYKRGELSHYSPTLGYVNDQLHNAKIFSDIGGENILEGAGTVKSAMNMWMNSPGHRTNILLVNYTHVGIGYYKGYWVQQFANDPYQGFDVLCGGCNHMTVFGAIRNDPSQKDSKGNSMEYFSCGHCGVMQRLCPICRKTSFSYYGILKNGGTVEKCRNCGYTEETDYIINCKTCGKEFTAFTPMDDFNLTFSDGESYFQQIGIYIPYCEACGNYATVSDYSNNMYQKCLEEFKENIDAGDNVYDYIKWERVVQTDDTPVLTKIETPKIDNLNKLLDKPRL